MYLNRIKDKSFYSEKLNICTYIYFFLSIYKIFLLSGKFDFWRLAPSRSRWFEWIHMYCCGSGWGVCSISSITTQKSILQWTQIFAVRADRRILHSQISKTNGKLCRSVILFSIMLCKKVVRNFDSKRNSAPLFLNTYI